MATTVGTSRPSIDQAKADAFVGKVFGDTVSTGVTVLATIGDRLGLFSELAARGPATSAELAERAGIKERYAREWLSALAAAGYLEYDSSSGRFILPAEHAPVLAQEGGPVFFGGVQQEMLGCVATIDLLTQSFRQGGGVRLSDYPDSMHHGIERFTANWFDNLLLQQWIPAVPEVQAKLERGCRVADVGSGRGRALIKLAQAYPESRFVGYEIHARNVDLATASAEAAGVSERVTFRQWDASQGLPARYDLITTFDVVHDAADPQGMLSAIHRALEPQGTYLCLEINCADTLEGNLNPLGALFYSFSVLLCMTSSLADGGAGLGTAGLPESKLRALATEAGFGSVSRLPLENPFNVLYALRP
jgi:SAM-dependent methyltransferase